MGLYAFVFVGMTPFGALLIGDGGRALGCAGGLHGGRRCGAVSVLALTLSGTPGVVAGC